MKLPALVLVSAFILSACDTNRVANQQMGIAATAILVGAFFADQ